MPEMSARVTLVALPDVRNGRAAAVGHRRRTHHTASLVPYVLAVLLSTPLSLAANGVPAHAADSREQRPAPAADGARLTGLGGEFGGPGAPGWYGTGHPQPDADSGPEPDSDPDSDPDGIAARSLRPDDRAARLMGEEPLDEGPLDEEPPRASTQTPRRHSTGSHVRDGAAADRTHEPERRPHARKSTPPRHHPRLRPARGRRRPAQVQATTPSRKPTVVRAPAPRTAPAPAPVAPEPSPPRTDDGGDVTSGSSRQLPPVQPPPVPPPLLPWGAGLASIGLGLALFALRLRR